MRSAHRLSQRPGSAATCLGQRTTLLLPRRLGVARGRQAHPTRIAAAIVGTAKEVSTKPAAQQQPVEEAKCVDDVEQRFPKPHFEPLAEIAVDESILLQGRCSRFPQTKPGNYLSGCAATHNSTTLTIVQPLSRIWLGQLRARRRRRVVQKHAGTGGRR